MSKQGFHEQPFDLATQLKLEILQGYLKEWLPVFLSKSSYPEIHIYDFFAGEGEDSAGRKGSPLIILDSVREYFATPKITRVTNVNIFLHFNDVDEKKIEKLKKLIDKRDDEPLFQNQVQVNYTSQDFKTCLEANIRSISAKRSANLIFIDQFGIKEMRQDLFKALVNCDTTDILFFLSSNTVKRFIKLEAIQKYIPIDPEKIKEVPISQIHRFICQNFYQKLVAPDKVYHLAPFSIKKDTSKNIYGLVFGTSKLLGLEKFLSVCWDADQVTGEANYNIDEDITFAGQMPLFSEDSTPKKEHRFKKDLISFLKEKSRNNLEVSEFTLKQGFLPSKHAASVLKSIQDDGSLLVEKLDTKEPARKGAFYLSWKKYGKKEPKVQFTLKVNYDVN
ncbi:MAG: three-Cys-motif partner protein TcmP [Candidatus Hydrogenedens sp.]|jgi:three-Cys-motif partner protein|nr:three-Cys-motif partner protein TcmP [Candidatus Hydrogenedens sp.]